MRARSDKQRISDLETMVCELCERDRQRQLQIDLLEKRLARPVEEVRRKRAA